jgi:hypothetical protein
MRIDSSGLVIVKNESAPTLRIENTDTSLTTNQTIGDIDFYQNDPSATGVGVVSKIRSINTSGFQGEAGLAFHTGTTGGLAERIRIRESGDLLVGQTSGASTDTGHIFNPVGLAFHVRDGGVTLVVDRLTNDGDLINLRKDGTIVGNIGVESGLYPYIGGNAGGSGDVFLVFISNTSQSIRPATASGASRDNAIDLGSSSDRFDDIYATNGTIQTSDRNEKQDIEALTDAETRVAVAAKGLLRKFRWQSAVEEKGDEARTHFGIIAQDLQDAFTAEGLDASDYAMFISTTWWETQTEVAAVEAVEEVTDEEGNVITEAVEAKDAYTRIDTYNTAEEAPEGATEKTRLGVRYSELLAFIIAAI